MLQRCCHRWNRHAADAARGDRKGLDVLLVEQGLVESKTPGGSWKPGDYRVDLCIEDRKIGSKAFTVESSGVPERDTRREHGRCFADTGALFPPPDA